MKKTKNPYHFLDMYCLRTPVLPIRFFTKIFNEEEHNYNKLKNIWGNKILKEAVFLASPYLFNELSNYFKEGFQSVSNKENLNKTLLKYAIRASTRCTPFGLFAGVSVGEFNKTSLIELKDIKEYGRITKYDTNYISSLLKNYAVNPEIKNQLLFFPNSTLYKIANQYRYVEDELNKTKKAYSIEAVEHTHYLEKIFKEAEKGKTIDHLANEIINNDISFEDAKEFINSLIENQLLVSELELNVTGKDSLSLLKEKLNSFKNIKEQIYYLELLKSHLTTIDIKIGNSTTPYENCFNFLKEKSIPFEEKYVFQTDLFVKTNANTLNIKHGYTIKKALPLLNKLSPLKRNEKLERFKKVFFDRYEAREMPLALVLDVELGVGYIQDQHISDTTPFLEDITPTKEIISEETMGWSEVHRIVYQKLLDAEKNNQFTIEINDKDFEHIESDWENIPDTLYASIETLKIDNNECLFIYGLGANAGNVLARFSYGDPKLLEHLKTITDLEQQIQPTKIMAEIVHLPETRTGNILKRPHLREYEIPYLAKSTLPLSQQITIDDLWVSIKKDKIILRSKRLNKEVIPKLTNAHNYKLKALPIYHFLCDLQSQDKKKYLGFSWPKITEKHSFLPRVTYKNSILSKAKWYLKEKDIKAFMINYHDKELLLASVQKWRMCFQIPKYVQLVEQDNTLLIDLEHFNSIQLLLATIKNNKHSLLEEFLHAEKTVVSRKNESFTNECIITLYNQEKSNQKNI